MTLPSRSARESLRRLGTPAVFAAFLGAAAPAVLEGQVPQAPPASPVERLGPNLLRVGNVRVDTAKREASVTGVVNAATTLEFIAGTKGGYKNYESALELDTNAINFNVALILIGLDPAHAVPPRFHIDPVAPKGDPVEMWVEWDESGQRRRIRAEELVYDPATKNTLSEGPWVYTGSVFVKDSNGFQADLDGALIGFVHSPAPLIDSPRTAAGPYGANKFNPNLNLKPGTSVVLTVRALPIAN
jgi:hypothetical protein